MTALPRLHFILPPEDRDSAIEQVWRGMLPSLNRRRWKVVDDDLGGNFDGDCDGIAVLPAPDGSVPERARIAALHTRFPAVPIYQLWRSWPAYERLCAADFPARPAAQAGADLLASLPPRPPVGAQLRTASLGDRRRALEFPAEGARNG